MIFAVFDLSPLTVWYVYKLQFLFLFECIVNLQFQKIYKGLKFGWFDILSDFCIGFSLCMRETVRYLVDISTFSSDFNQLVIMHTKKWRYFHFLSDICTHLRSQRRQIHVKGWNCGDLATFRTISAIFSLRMRKRGYLSVSVHNAGATIQFGDLNYPVHKNTSHPYSKEVVYYLEKAQYMQRPS